MLYKNKNIRALYKVPFMLMIGGFLMMIAGAIVLGIGLVATKDALNMANVGEVINKIEDKKVLSECGFHLVVGGILAVAGIVMLVVNAITIYISRKFDSLSEITAIQVDEEICKDSSIWFPTIQIYVTENMVAGFPADIGNMNFSQSAFKYGEIKKIYGRIVKSNNTFGSLILGKFRIIAVTNDDKNLVLSEVLANGYVKAKVLDELNSLYDECKKRNKSITCVPATLDYGD